MEMHTLNGLVEAVCPVYGINSSGVVWFKPEATEAQMEAAHAVVAANLSKLGEPNPNAEIDAEIRMLEGTTERGIREGMLYTLVILAASQGITEPQLYAMNYGYRKAKDLDTAIAALRAQRV